MEVNHKIYSHPTCVCRVDLKLAATGFGGMYGGTVDKTGADKSGRYAEKSRKGLRIKGKKVAEWQN